MLMQSIVMQLLEDNRLQHKIYGRDIYFRQRGKWHFIWFDADEFVICIDCMRMTRIRYCDPDALELLTSLITRS